VIKATAGKADKREVEAAVQEVTAVVQRGLAGKADWKEVEGRMEPSEQAQRRVEEVLAMVRAELDRKLDVQRGGEMEEGMLARVEECMTQMSVSRRDLRLKADIKDVNVLLDSKADVDEVNRALLDINAQLNLKASATEVATSLQEQAALCKALASEFCLGRWIWKSLKTKTGGVVPWNIQTANSDPGNLVWEKDKGYIACLTPGLYEVQFGFFSRRRPVVKLHVNTEPVLTVANCSTAVTYHAGGRLLSSGRYTNSNITGLTHVDFIALPAKARVSITYQGDEDAEAFLGLRKL